MNNANTETFVSPNFMLTGGTETGKTTLSICNELPKVQECVDSSSEILV